MAVQVTTLTRSALSQFLPNDQAIRWAESLTQAAQSFVSGGGGGALTPSGVTAGNYGTNSSVGAFTVDINGIITAASNTPIMINGSQVTGNITGSAGNVTGVVAIANGGTGQITANAALNALLPTQSFSTVGQVLQSNGTNTSWQTVSGGGGSGTVTQVDGALGEITGGPITITGTLGLATTGVVAATYGSASYTSQVAFDSKGRATSASSILIAITGAQVSGNIAGNAANVTGVVAVANGGSGATTLTGYVKGNGTSAFTAAAGIPQADVTGLTAALAGKVDTSRTITGTLSVSGGGDLTANRTLSLVNDAGSPGALQYYGTDPSGAKGYFSFPAAGAVTWGSITGTLSAQSDLQTALNLKANNATTITGTNSIAGGGDLSANRTLALVGDASAPGASRYYGTDGAGAKGFYALPSGTGSITSVTSTGGSLAVTSPSGPVVNVELSAPVSTANGGTGLLVPFYVTNIADMVALPKASLVNGQPCIVMGYGVAGDGGGDPFYWDSASTATVNTGTVFQAAAGGNGRWFRLIDDAGVDLLWFGADRSGATNSSTAFNNAYSYAATASSGYVRSIFIPAGTYLVSSNLTDNLTQIKGEGYISSKFVPTTATGSALTLTDTSGTLLPAVISDMGFEGAGTRQGVAIDHIAGSGRAMVSRAYIRNFNIGINRSTGNFQEWYRDISMANNNYHFYNVSTPTAQGGSLFVNGGNYGTAELASNYINCDTGQSGQFIYDGVFWQGNNTGWTFFIKFAETRDSPSIVVRDCYVEQIYKTAPITIDGYTSEPGFAYLENCGMFRVVNSVPNAMILINSNVETTSADLTYMNTPSMGVSYNPTSIDATSTMNHYQARWTNNYNIPGFVHSVTNITASSTPIGTGSWYETFQLMASSEVVGATTAILNNCSAPISFADSTSITTTSQTDTGIAGLSTCQDLVIPNVGSATITTSPNSGATSIAAGTYIAWVWVGKLLSGTAPDMYLWGAFVGGTQLTVKHKVDSADFVTLKGLNYLTAACAHIGLEYRAAASSPCTVRMAGYAVMTFTDKQQALNWLNSTVFPT